MRKWCPNYYHKEDGLETVLEVPIPEEMFNKMGSSANLRWHNLRSLMRACPSSDQSNNNEFMALVKLVGSPLIPYQVQFDGALNRPIRDGSIEASTAKYIVQQYVAATGGHAAFNWVNSMYAVGQVKIIGQEMHPSEDFDNTIGNWDAGGFVIWQKNPDMWSLELIVAGFKVCAGSDGKVAWSQSSSQPSQANGGHPRPLRRFFQGLHPRCTANLFIEGVCIGEKRIDNEECFVLKVEADPNILASQSSLNTEVVHHTVWGYFSQRTGLLVKFEDTKLVRMKHTHGGDGVFWETSMESTINDYKNVDSINIAHSGRSVTTLHRYGGSHNHKRKIEEIWQIEEVDFNICGLSTETFLPPTDLKREPDTAEQSIS